MRLLPLLCFLTLTTCARAPESARPVPTDAAAAPTRPNILFILTDDQGIGDLSLAGNDSIRTPNMDRLLQMGARFDRFYVSPVCAPTRASFLSGQYHPRTGAIFVTRRLETMDDAVKTLPEYLREAGYRTGLFGKWHNGATFPYHPAAQGFDEFLGFTLGHFNDYFSGELRNERDEPVPFRGDLTEILTDSTLHFLLESEEPTFAMLAYQAPHTPVQVADRFYDPVTERGLSPYNTGIYAMVESVDHQIGRLLDTLESAGKLRNTIVVFSSDNGPNGDRFRRGLRGTKGQVDEGGVRSPFVIKLPGDHPANGTNNELVPAAHIDLLPTLLDYLGEPVPEGLDGESLLPVLNLAGEAGVVAGSEQDNLQRRFHRRPIYTFKQGWTWTGEPGSVRSGNWLYVRRGPDRHELYNLRRDPGQTRNVYRPGYVPAPDLTPPDTTQTYQYYSHELRTRYDSMAAAVAPAADLLAPPIDLDAAPGTIRLLAHEGEPRGATHFADEYGWANDYFVDLGPDGAAWPVVATDYRPYQVTVFYRLAADAPRTLFLDGGTGTPAPLELRPAEALTIEVADRVRRKEVYPRDWARAELPVLMLGSKTTELRVTAEPGVDLWLKEIHLTPLDDEG